MMQVCKAKLLGGMLNGGDNIGSCRRLVEWELCKVTKMTAAEASGRGGERVRVENGEKGKEERTKILRRRERKQADKGVSSRGQISHSVQLRLSKRINPGQILKNVRRGALSVTFFFSQVHGLTIDNGNSGEGPIFPFPSASASTQRKFIPPRKEKETGT